MLCDCEFVGKVANFSSSKIYPEAARADAGSPLRKYYDNIVLVIMILC